MLNVSLLVCASLLWSGGNCDAQTTIEKSLSDAHETVEGEYWYQIAFQETPIGSLLETRQRLTNGEYELKRSLEFRLTTGRVTQVDEILRFDARPPFGLRSAEEIRSTTSQGTTHTSTRKLTLDESNHKRVTTFSYLHTFPFFQLATESSNPIEEHHVDFDRNDIRLNSWEVTGTATHDSDLVVVKSSSGAIRHLQHDGIPLFRASQDGMTHYLSSMEDAEAWRTAEPILSDHPISVPVTPPIRDHRRLTSLTLQIHSNASGRSLWEGNIETDGYLLINREPKLLVTDMPEFQNGATIDQATKAVLRGLIDEQGLEGGPTKGSITRLINFLHTYIQYEEIDVTESVIDTLARRSGDCTEFADVFHAFSQELGWQTRIQDGLAYHPPTQSFRVHSWNEIALDGTWISADAGWGQFPADASHVPFPPANMLALLAQARSMHFTVIDTRYEPL